jgi:hypothetical protein
MPFREKIAVYCENHVEHTNSVGRIKGFIAVGTYSNDYYTG